MRSRNEDTSARERFTKYDTSTKARFFAKVGEPTAAGCHPWTACRGNDNYGPGNGYGHFRLGKVVRQAHRIAWEIANGREIPDGLYAMHQCHNPGCVNPDHIHLGTQAANMAAMVLAGRSPQMVGERNGRCKLTDADVANIRTLRESGLPVKAIAAKYDVSLTHVYDIVKGAKRLPTKGVA